MCCFLEFFLLIFDILMFNSTKCNHEKLYFFKELMMTVSFNNLHSYSTVTCQCSLVELQPLTVAYVSCLKGARAEFHSTCRSTNALPVQQLFSHS